MSMKLKSVFYWRRDGTGRRGSKGCAGGEVYIKRGPPRFNLGILTFASIRGVFRQRHRYGFWKDGFSSLGCGVTFFLHCDASNSSDSSRPSLRPTDYGEYTSGNQIKQLHTLLLTYFISAVGLTCPDQRHFIITLSFDSTVTVSISKT